MVKNNYSDLKIKKVILRYPKLLQYDLVELESLLSSFKNYEITGQMIQSAPEIFHLDTNDFNNRIESLKSNPFTLVYQKHPRFLILVRDFNISLPRIKYLQEKNLKHATIHTLTTFHNYIEL